MSNWIVTDGNELKFDPQFGPNWVTPTEPCLIHGSGEASILNKKICILGDERRISISATYTKPPYQTPGTGKITLTRLAADQQMAFVQAKKPVIVVGSQFTAQFTPSTPATDPQGKPDPDVAKPITATGKFINSQSFVMAG